MALDIMTLGGYVIVLCVLYLAVSFVIREMAALFLSAQESTFYKSSQAALGIVAIFVLQFLLGAVHPLINIVLFFLLIAATYNLVKKVYGTSKIKAVYITLTSLGVFLFLLLVIAFIIYILQ
jgi:hypothetical protein